MDLTQSKPTKAQWQNAEIPVCENEKLILNLMIDGWHDVNHSINLNKSLFQIINIKYTAENEVYLYNKYFKETIQEILSKVKTLDFTFSSNEMTFKTPKNLDIIRIDNMDKTIDLRKNTIFEYTLLYFGKTVLYSLAKKNEEYAFALYTLLQIQKNTISLINSYVLNFIKQIIQYVMPRISMRYVMKQSPIFIEKNPNLLKYKDKTLFSHQKQLFTILKKNPETPKLILYIAPTGTGKTLSPIGISEQYRVIFVCVSSHVGWALAKSAISVGKRVAFAFGCETASDIRLHNFAASNYSKNKKSGGIGKVDNSIGYKVEIMICDVQSYITAMHYMLSFFEETKIVVFWDEPTITMDYEEHPIHPIMHHNWVENKISKMILSCATLPDENEIQETICDFRAYFDGAEVYTIKSYDCEKSISILNKDGICVLPHTIPDFVDYDKLLCSVEYLKKQKTMLRYFDLTEIVRYLEIIHNENIVEEPYLIENYFETITDITMNSLKNYYLETFTRIITPEKWGVVFEKLQTHKLPKFIAPTPSKNSYGGNPISKIQSVCVSQPVPNTKEINKTTSLDIPTTYQTQIAPISTGVLYTTADAHTITDGPMIFLADDVEKIGKFYIQSSKIPKEVLAKIMEKIDVNTEIQKKMSVLENILEDKMNSTTKGMDEDKKDRKEQRNETQNGEIVRLVSQIDVLRQQILSVNLENGYVPNHPKHQEKWTGVFNSTAFMPEIDDTVVKEIMELDVENYKKILLLLGIGMFSLSNHPTYMEIMKRLAYEQKLYIIIASSDYIYGTNFQFCHAVIGKDLTQMTQQKIIQAMGRVGRNKVQQEYTVRFREDEILMKLFHEMTENKEAQNMCKLFSGKI
jgi:hypothetical protein